MIQSSLENGEKPRLIKFYLDEFLPFTNVKDDDFTTVSTDKSQLALISHTIDNYNDELTKIYPRLCAFATQEVNRSIISIQIDKNISFIESSCPPTREDSFRNGEIKKIIEFDNENITNSKSNKTFRTVISNTDEEKSSSSHITSNQPPLNESTYSSRYLPHQYTDISNYYSSSLPNFIPTQTRWEMFASPSPNSKKFSTISGISNSSSSKQLVQTESLESLRREVESSRQRLQKARMFVYENLPSQHSMKTEKDVFPKEIVKQEKKNKVMSDLIEPNSENNSKTEVPNDYECTIDNSNILDNVRKEMKEDGTLLSAPRSKGKKLREAWKLNPTLPEHLHGVGDIESTGFVRLSRLLTVLRLHEYLDWTEEEVKQICVCLANQKNDGYEDEISVTQIHIKELDGTFYLNTGAFFSLLRSLLVL